MDEQIVLFAEVTASVVTRIHVVAQAVVDDGGEQAGQTLLADLYGGDPATYILGTIDGSIRYNRPMEGDTYDEERDAFIPPKPFDSWILNEETCLWEAPIPYPEDGLVYSWDEVSQDWIEVVEPSA